MPALTQPRDLKPCPFCGVQMTQQYDRPNPNVRCWTAWCHMHHSQTVLNLDDDEAVARWNTRVEPQHAPPALPPGTGWSASFRGVRCLVPPAEPGAAHNRGPYCTRADALVVFYGRLPTGRSRNTHTAWYVSRAAATAAAELWLARELAGVTPNHIPTEGME